MVGNQMLKILLMLLLSVQQASAAVVLGFGVCNSQGTQLSPIGNGSWFNPYTSVGLNDWTFGQSVVGTDTNPLVVPSVIYLQIQLTDSAPYTFTDNSPMATWGVQLEWSGAVAVSPDNDTADGLAFNVTVNNGTGHSNENLPYANSNVVGNSFGISQLLLSGWSGLPDDPTTRKYALANVRVDVWGAGTLSMSDISLFQDNWADQNNVGYDSLIFASAPMIHVVPEPSSFVLLLLLAFGSRKRFISRAVGA